SVEVGPSGDDFTGQLALAAGIFLVGLGASTLWTARRRDDRSTRRYVRRPFTAAAAEPAIKSRRGCSSGTATASCSSIAAERAKATATSTSSAGRRQGPESSPELPAAATRRKPRAGRRDRPLRRRRDTSRDS